MDGKGKTIAVLKFSNKTVVRENCSFGKNLVNLFGLKYYSWHAEVRCLICVIKNSYYRSILRKENRCSLTVLRYNKRNKLTPNSKPCSKCLKFIRMVKRKYFPETVFEIFFIENNKMKRMLI